MVPPGPGPGSYTDEEDEQKVRIQSGILSGGAEMAAQSHQQQAVTSTPYSHEKQVTSGLGYSDLEVFVPPEVPGLEVAASDAPQAIPSQYVPPYYRPKLEEFPQQSSVGSIRTATTFTPETATVPPNYYYNGGNNPFEPSPPASPRLEQRIWGLKKRTFFIVLGVVILGLLLALGVGIGVGVGAGSKSNDTASSGSSSSTSSNGSSTSTSTTSGASGTIPTSLPAALATGTATADIGIVCPAANRTLYSIPSSATGQKFLVLCGRDYNSANGAVDLTSLNETTFEGCLNQCAQYDGCVAVGWGTYYDVETCWLKSQIGVPNQSSQWYSAVQDNDG